MKTNYMKKWLAITGLLIASLSVQASLKTGACGDDLIWSLDDQTGLLVIKGTGEMNSCPWEQYDWDKIKTVIVEEGVTTLVDGAFASSTVETVKLPSTLKSISNWAFRWCKSLVSINIPYGIKSIGAQAFAECPLTSIDLPFGLTSIGEGAFRYTNLTSIVLPPAHLGQGVFESCYDLKTVVMTDGRTIIEDGAFAGCYNLSSVSLPPTLKEIGGSAFSSTAIQEVIVPEGVTRIGEYAFSHSGLVRVLLPSTLETIEDYAFLECKQLRTIRCLALTPPETKGSYPLGVTPYNITKEVLASVLDEYKEKWEHWDSSTIVPINAEVTIGSTGYTTFYWPYEDLKIPESLQAFVGHVNGEWLSLTEIRDKIAAGTPVILKGKEGTYGFNHTTGAEPVGENDLKGTDNRLTTDGSQYVLATKDGKTGFYKTEANTFIASGKAYLEIPGAGVKVLSFGDETGIEHPTLRHAIVNEEVYDLSGHRIEKATKKGMYIINGKKVLK